MRQEERKQARSGSKSVRRECAGFGINSSHIGAGSRVYLSEFVLAMVQIEVHEVDRAVRELACSFRTRCLASCTASPHMRVAAGGEHLKDSRTQPGLESVAHKVPSLQVEEWVHHTITAAAFPG